MKLQRERGNNGTIHLMFTLVDKYYTIEKVNGFHVNTIYIE